MFFIIAYMIHLSGKPALSKAKNLENSSFPFAARILESLKRNGEQAAAGQPMEGISHELIEQLRKEKNGGSDIAQAVTSNES